MTKRPAIFLMTLLLLTGGLLTDGRAEAARKPRAEAQRAEPVVESADKVEDAPKTEAMTDEEWDRLWNGGNDSYTNDYYNPDPWAVRKGFPAY